MGTFSYTNLHIFDKRGHEIPLNYISGLDITVPNEYGESAEFYAVTNPEGAVDYMMPKSFGGRYRTLPDSSVIPCVLTTADGETHSEKIRVTTKEYVSYPETYKYIKSIDASSADMWVDLDSSAFAYPSATFITRIPFQRVSTELVETESLYILVEEDGEFILPSESKDCRKWSNRYDIIFYIDCRNQTDFRTFTVNSDSIVWSDRQTINLSSTNEIHVGFTGENEGVYEESMYMCIYDKTVTNDVYPVGEFVMEAEAVGEDERYRTLFTDFGIPDPKEYNDIFNDTEGYDDKVDNISLNEHSKKVFLSYSEIFPYVGSYKALVNAVNMLGYTDIFFKEWYKDLGKISGYENGYVAFDINYKSDSHANLISNAPIEERIQLRKLNWLSMMYHLNKEIYGEPEDMYGFPPVEKNSIYYSPETIAKLISLRKWLEKYIIGVHCRIIDIGGEGVCFERYRMSAHPSYQQVLEYNDSMDISPQVLTPLVYIDGSGADVEVSVDNYTGDTTFDDMSDVRLADLCDGYIDASGIYRIATKDTSDGMVMYTGKTLAINDNDNVYELRLSGKCDGFMFGNENGYISSGAGIIVDNGKFMQIPSELADASTFTTIFAKLPIVILEVASLRSSSDDGISDAYSIRRNSSSTSNPFIFTKHGDGGYDYAMGDVLTLIPGPDAEFGMSCDNIFKSPQFYVKGYTSANAINDASVDIDSSKYDLDILDGKMLFTDPEYDRKIILNITGNGTTTKTSSEVDAVYHGGRSELYEYTDGSASFSRFSPGKSYESFVEAYETDPDSAIVYDPTLTMTLHNSGEYTVEVICSDEHNTMYYSKAPDTIKVETKDVCMDMISADSDGSSVDPDEITRLYSESNDCIFEYVPKDIVNGMEDESDGVVITSRTYTNYCNLEEIDGVTQFSTLAYAVDDIEFNGDAQFTASLRIKDSSIMGVTSDIAAGMAIEYVMTEKTDPLGILEALDASAFAVETEFDVNIIVYDSLSESAMMQLPARAIYGEDGEVYVMFMRDIVDPYDVIDFKNFCDLERYSVHIQPTWSTKVIISATDDDTMTCSYVNEYHFSMSPREGDVMRLIIMNRNYPSIVAGCSYYAADNADPENVRLIGSIDEECVGDNKEPVYYELAEQDKYVVKDGHLYGTDGSPVYFNGSNKQIAAVEANGIKYASVYYLTEDGMPERVYYQSSREYKTRLRLACANLAYTSYDIQSVKLSDSNAMENVIMIDSSVRQENIAKHVDSAFTAVTREFSTDAARTIWMTDDDASVFADSAYLINRPVTVILDGSNPARIIARADINAMFGPDAEYDKDAFCRWRLYRRGSANKSSLILDVYDKSLCISTFEKGIYDIESIVYDKYGNKHDRMFIGAFTVE